MKILVVFGTRPEVIKMAPVIRQIEANPGRLSCCVCLTGQHRQMTSSLLRLFDIKVDHDLDIMAKNQGLEHIVVEVLTKINPILEIEKPDYVMVQGDTSTAMAAALGAFYKKIKVAHIEAGLRTWNKHHPYPEEANRRIIDSISDLFFAHTQDARNNLLREGICDSCIEVTGNTVIDSLLETAQRQFDPQGPIKDIMQKKEKLILVTAHRRESFGETFKGICYALKDIAAKYPDMRIVYPVHLNPNVQNPVREILGAVSNISLIEPLDYLAFVHLMKRAYLILTDSGGVQEEAPSLGKPVLVLRQTTERFEAVRAQTVQIIGTAKEAIVTAVDELIENKEKYDLMSRSINPYGDGKASGRIINRMLQEAVKL